MRDLSNKDDLTQKLLQTSEGEIESLFAKEMAKYNEFLDAIKATYAEQGQLLQHIQVRIIKEAKGLRILIYF